MESVYAPVTEEITERIEDGEEWTQEMKHSAIDYAQTYALRDVMTLMDCGHTLDEAFAMWKDGPGPLNLEGECMNAVDEAYWDYNEDEEDYDLYFDEEED